MVHVLREFTVTLSDRPGAMAELCTALGEGGVNLAGFLGYARGGPSELRFVASDAAKAEAFLRNQRWKWRVRDALAVAGADEPGFVGGPAERLAKAGVNIEAAYLALHGGEPLAVFSVDDVGAAKKALA